VALAKGYYKEAGIDLTINPGGPNLLTENLVASGADTFGLSGGTDSVLAGVEKGLPIVSVGVAHQITPFVFVTRKDGPIKTLKDFEGKKVTAWFTGANYVLLGMLAKAGVDRSKVDLQPQQVSVTPFVNGEVDVITATRYNELWSIRDRMGADKLQLFVAEDSGITFPRDTVIVSRETAQKNPELVKGFLQASIRGWREAMAHPKEAVDLVMKIAPTLNRAQQEFMLTEAYRLMTAGKASTEGLFYIDGPAIRNAHDFLLTNKVLAKAVDTNVAFDASFLKAIPLADRKP
jgi:NitT/TauT family transport system substrate-binding protein